VTVASQIDPSKPADGVPAAKADLRANLQAAKSEIEALQAGKSKVWTRAANATASETINNADHETMLELTHGAGAITVTMAAATAANNEGGVVKATGQTVNVVFQAAQGAGMGAKYRLPNGTTSTAGFALTGTMIWKVLENPDGDSAVYLIEGETSRALGLEGTVVSGNLAGTGTATGTLTAADSGKVLRTTGNVKIPQTPGFNVTLVAGGAHTVTFGATTSPAMASGDLMSIVVDSTTAIHAVRTLAADKVGFS
jgi:hypothetical protein